MLASTGKASSPDNNTSQPLTAASPSNSPSAAITVSCSSSPAAVIGSQINSSSNNNSSNNNNAIINVKSNKCDTHLAASPTDCIMSADASSNSQRLLDEAAGAIKSSADISPTMQRDSSVLQNQQRNNQSNAGSNATVNGNAVAAVTLLLHNNNTSSTAPSHNNDNSNSSHSAISQILESETMIGNSQQQTQHHDSNSSTGMKSTIKSNITEDCNDGVNNTSGNFTNACTSKEGSISSSSSSSSSSSASSLKDDPEISSVLDNLTNVKKEQQNSNTPEMSSDRFSSLHNLATNNTSTGVSGVGTSPGVNNNNNNKTANILSGGGLSSNTAGGGGGSCMTALLHDGSSNGQPMTNNNNNINNFGGNVSIMPNSMDYMQQQNHIFVFSTQLANKGAESVLSGQFPTIIAYHCTQPATKKFLEDFFLKNPMKMAKMQRQNNLNMAISVSTSHQWVIGSGNCLPNTKNQKLNSRNSSAASAASTNNNNGNNNSNSITNNAICNNICMDEKSRTATTTLCSGVGKTPNPNFSDSTDALTTAESDLMNWEQTNISLDNITNNANSNSSNNNVTKIDDIPEGGIIATPHLTQQSPNNKANSSSNNQNISTATPLSPGDNNSNSSIQPPSSLQGVKVPDENLTPQQRQHREEQLAKLKKMNQFLFPEHGSGGGDLLPPDGSGAGLQLPHHLAKINADLLMPNSGGATGSSGGLTSMLSGADTSSSTNSTVMGGGACSGGSAAANAQNLHLGANNIVSMGRGGVSTTTMCGRNPTVGGATDATSAAVGLSVGLIGAPTDINNVIQHHHCANPNNVLTSNLLMNTHHQPGLQCGAGNMLASSMGVGGANASAAGVSGGMIGTNHPHLAQAGIMSHATMNTDTTGNSNNNSGSNNSCGTSTSGVPSASGGLMLQSGHSKGGHHLAATHQLECSGVGSGNVSGQTQMEWSKMQQHFYEERSAGRNQKGTPTDIMTGISGLCRSISSSAGGGGTAYVRHSQILAAGLNNSSLPSNRSQGPPPPYHPTQRSASVPIATQSPNPSSPNNPTSNLSLPSPRTASGSCGTNLNSPSSDGLVTASSTITTSTSISAAASAAITAAATTNASNQCKAFQQDDSPTGPNNSNNNMGNGNNNNSNLRNSLNHFNSNPSTPLSNVSPKGLDSLNSTGLVGDVKNTRPSPQRSRTPHSATANSITEQSSMDAGRFPPASPGVNFATHLQNQGNSSNGGVKHAGGVTADNLASLPAPHFGRRPDNLPLNPNSSRPPPIKQNHHFDPISSLAQMSQQLTSCISSNGGNLSGGGGGPSSVLTNSIPNEISIGGTASSSHPNMVEGLLGPIAIDGVGIDHCGNIPHGSSGGMSLPPHMLGVAGGGQYGRGCHIGGGGASILNPIGGSRLLGPKLGGVGFGAGGSGSNVMRDGAAGFHSSSMPPHRMIGRMGVNFCPFNGSPNIQVKASTPNTIQYMPARPQTNNGNQRIPPSLEFLQRFANPQLAGPNNISGGGGESSIASVNGSGGGGGGGVSVLPLGAGNTTADLNKIANAANANLQQNSSMNFFQNCNMSSGGHPDEMMLGPGMMPSHSDLGSIMNMGGGGGGTVGGGGSVGLPAGGSMNIRGMRPLRQGPIMGPGAGSLVGGIHHRMQQPSVGSHLIGGPGSSMNHQFGVGGSNNPHEIMDCINNDASGMFGSATGGGVGGSNPLFGVGPPQQKGSPMAGPANHRQNGMNSGGIGTNDQQGVAGGNPMQQHLNGTSGMGLGPNVPNGPNVSGSAGGVSGMSGSIVGAASNIQGNYKSYMGHSTNDLKYAQQYHNFQQQLYATTTRSHISQQQMGGGASVMGIPGNGLSPVGGTLTSNTNSGFFVNK